MFFMTHGRSVFLDVTLIEYLLTYLSVFRHRMIDDDGWSLQSMTGARGSSLTGCFSFNDWLLGCQSSFFDFGIWRE